jgi:hypothetical protein
VISTILTYALVGYLGVAALLFIMFIVGTVGLGGFQQYADAANVIADDDKPFTANKVQWYFVLVPLLWPLVLLLYLLP